MFPNKPSFLVYRLVISKLDTDEIKSPYREDIRPDGEEFVRSVKISHRRRPDGKYTELIRIIHEVLGASVENYEPDMYDSITLNDTQVCRRQAAYILYSDSSSMNS